jgi:hypothetical protein
MGAERIELGNEGSKECRHATNGKGKSSDKKTPRLLRHGKVVSKSATPVALKPCTNDVDIEAFNRFPKAEIPRNRRLWAATAPE